MVSRRIGFPSLGSRVETNTGNPKGVLRGSTAIERPGDKGTFMAPSGPAPVDGLSRKNT
jgi:hypothetical protein